MRNLKLLAASVVVILSAGSTPSLAAAPFGNFYVDAENGTDSATCGSPSLATPSTGPCRTLNQALANATFGDTIVVTKGAAVGPIYLTGSIAIIGPPDGSLRIINSSMSGSPAPGCIGAAAGTCAASTTAGVEINAGTGSVRFEHVLISAGFSGTAAILVDAASDVSMNGVTIRGGKTTSTGAMVTVTHSSGALNLYMHDCDIGHSTTLGGLLLQPTGSASASVEFSGGQLHHAVFGLQINATSTTGSLAGAFDTNQFFAINNSATSVNGTTGVASIIFSRNTIVNTGGAAVRVNGANATARIYENVFTGNSAGVNVVGGAQAVTFANSAISGNANDCLVSGSPTPCSTALTSQPLN